jgi:hypothetical protein
MNQATKRESPLFFYAFLTTLGLGFLFVVAYLFFAM